MNYSILDDLSNILDRFTKNYLKREGYSHPTTINNGECFIWAWHVYHFLKSRGIENVELVTCESFGGHAWVEINGLAYDSEHTDGIDPDDLIYELDDGDEDEPEVYPMTEVSFFHHWVNYGCCGYRMVDIDFMKTLLMSIVQCGRGYKKTKKLKTLHYI